MEAFLCRVEWYNAIKMLSREDKGDLLDLLFRYHIDEEEEPNKNLNNPQVNLVFQLILPSIVRARESYDKRCETSRLNGLKGGRPKANSKEPKNNLKKPNETLSKSKSKSNSKNKLKEKSTIVDTKKEENNPASPRNSALFYPVKKLAEFYKTQPNVYESAAKELGKTTEDIFEMIDDFTAKLYSEGRMQDTFNEFCKYFVNHHRKNPRKKSVKVDGKTFRSFQEAQEAMNETVCYKGKKYKNLGWLDLAEWERTEDYANFQKHWAEIKNMVSTS